MPSNTPGRRAQTRANMEAAILQAGRQQLAERGAAALSLREIARSIGVVSSAVYRYVESRDALLTLLVVDAYSQLADAVEQELTGLNNAEEELRGLAMAMREWAIHHPEQWGLIYGTPVPGYEAPRETTSAPGMRVMEKLLQVSMRLAHGTNELPHALTEFLEAGSAELHQAATPQQTLFAVRTWCTITGTISMEVFGQLGPELGADRNIGQAILEQQVTALCASS